MSSSLGRDLVAAANCGTANPLSALGTQLQSQSSAQLPLDAKLFSSLQNQQQQNIVLPQNAQQLMLARPQQQQRVQHKPQQQQQQTRHESEILAAQFNAMQMREKQQQQAMEQAFAIQQQQQQQHQPQMGADWSNELLKQQQQKHPHSASTAMIQTQHQQHLRPQQYMPSQALHNSIMSPHMLAHQQQQQSAQFAAMQQQHSMRQQQYMQQFAAMQMQQQQQQHQMMHQQKLQQQSQQNAQIEELHADTLQQSEFINSFGDQINDPTAVQSQASDLNADSQQTTAGGMGGLDKATLDRLLASDNPKWRNSKFLSFINRISRGEIEFKDNQAIERSAADIAASKMQQQQSSTTLDELDKQDFTRKVEAVSADWYNQFSSESQQQSHDPSMPYATDPSTAEANTAFAADEP
jgi:hypothetical protein